MRTQVMLGAIALLMSLQGTVAAKTFGTREDACKAAHLKIGLFYGIIHIRAEAATRNATLGLNASELLEDQDKLVRQYLPWVQMHRALNCGPLPQSFLRRRK